MIVTYRAAGIALTLFVLIAASVFLASHKVPAPTHTVEKVLGNDRFLK